MDCVIRESQIRAVYGRQDTESIGVDHFILGPHELHQVLQITVEESCSDFNLQVIFVVAECQEVVFNSISIAKLVYRIMR